MFQKDHKSKSIQINLDYLGLFVVNSPNSKCFKFETCTSCVLVVTEICVPNFTLRLVGVES